MSKNLYWSLALLLTGIAWGLSIPLTKIAVSSGHQPLGLIFWQLLISVVILSLISALRRKSIPISRQTVGFCLFVAIFGTVLPNSFSYLAAANLPAGIMAIIISMVPIFSLPIAIALKIESTTWLRTLGIALGAAAIITLIAPVAELPGANTGIYLLIALIAPFCYGIEDNYVSLKGSAGLDPMQVILGASILGLILATPLASLSGQWVDLTQPWSAPEWALLASATLHCFAYTSFIWLITKTGPVFASMVAYIVTGSGVLWSILLLSESYTGPIWIALGLMIAAMTLVRPRHT